MYAEFTFFRIKHTVQTYKKLFNHLQSDTDNKNTPLHLKINYT